MQRHYVMYYEMSYGLNIEMHKQQINRHLLHLLEKMLSRVDKRLHMVQRIDWIGQKLAAVNV
ncbi:hypothetical protein P7K49_001046 [Saguinus oedipus]|uniref:Groucho/TLE N-terminal Q-rich domain-containing protein n=1 Tax=Saguinus oedipus TaxID=9490 RepID=A0ABQ9WDD3_SAGOE|nr:hypothetical protein P7K49_001046 [Saguinus oedipus]